jgi:putative Ca2+/H+ antiporter (TMEM165/GDT1 family)
VDVGLLLTTFALIVPVEFPDKTFVATLVLATATGRSRSGSACSRRSRCSAGLR